MNFVYLLLIVIYIKSTISLINFDLSYSIKSTDPVFPAATPFNFTNVYTSWRKDNLNISYFVAINSFTTSEHFGTHLDAPYHGSNTSWTVEQIPFDRLVSIQALIVDVSKKSSKIDNYHIKIEDLNEEIMRQANGYFVLLFYTGKTKYWPNQDTYAGGYTREELNFPGLSPQLASYLVENYSDKLVGVGIDTLSSKFFDKTYFYLIDLVLVDPGSSKFFTAHQTLFKANIYAIENVAGLDRVLKYLSSERETFFSFDVLPMKIQGGTGAPCRLVARLEDFKTRGGGWFGFLIFCLLVASIGIGAKAVYDVKFNPEKNFG